MVTSNLIVDLSLEALHRLKEGLIALVRYGLSAFELHICVFAFLDPLCVLV